MESKSHQARISIGPGPVVFIVDRVMHYHRATFQALERRLSQAGVDFILLSSLDKPSASGRVAENHPVVKNHRFFRLLERNVGSFTVRYQLGVLGIIRQVKPAIVVSTSHSGTLTEWALFFLKTRNPFLHFAWQCGYEYNPGRLKSAVLRVFVPRFDHHLAYHTNAKKYVIAHGAGPKQVTVMHNTVDEAAIRRGSRETARASIEAAFPVLTGKKIVLYVGAILEEKRLEVVFDALDRLRRRDVSFLVVGDGPYLDSIRRRCAYRQDVVIAGRVVDGVGAFFDAADVFVLPGTGGLAINEAMAHGLPVISGYADGSADDLVIHRRTGYRLRLGDADELADCLRDVLVDGERAAKMGREGEALIRGEFSFERFIDRIASVLTDTHEAGSI